MKKHLQENDKRKIANEQVKAKIRLTLLELLKEQNALDISVTELTQRAGVSRSSFYRNYNSFEEIIQEIIDGMIADYERTKANKKEDFQDYEFVHHIFKFYEKYADIVMTVGTANLSVNILEEITNYILSANGDMKNSSISKYELYYYAGAGHSVIQQWIKNGMKESPEEMAKEFCRISRNQK